MKKLAFVISDMGMGGAQRVISLLASHFEEAGWQVDIVTMDGPNAQSFFPLPESVKIHRLNLLGQSSGILANIRRIKLLRAALKNIRPDCVVSFQTETNCTTLLAMMGLKIPVVISERSDPYIHPQAKIWRVIRRLVYPLARSGVFQTQHAARFFEHIVRNKAVIFNPVNTEDAEGNAPIGPYILGVGRLSREKGFHDLVAALSIAQSTCTNLSIVLVGDGPEKAALEEQARQSGARVVFAGTQNNIAPYYKSALAFALPSQFEGLPNALLEALHHGCAVISTPAFAAAPEIINHGQDGLIAGDSNPEAMAKEIVKIYKDAALRDKLGTGAKVSSARFSAPVIIDQWIKLLNSITLRAS